MINHHDRSGGQQRAGDPERDRALEALLSHLDPARTRPDYWPSLRRSLVGAARFELARRRRLSNPTVTGMVASWARAVVPSAIVAAAAAVVTLIVTPPPHAGPIVELGVEELLLGGLGSDAVPASVDEPSVSITLAAAEIF